MHTWRNKASSSPSSSSSSSHSDSLLKHRRHEADGFNFFNTRSVLFGQKRRLTRQRKIRHLSDRDLGLSNREHGRAYSLPVSPDSAMGSPSPRDWEHWSLSAVPQPLPLPELCRREGFSFSDHPNSPKEGPGGCDGTGEGALSSSTFMSSFGGQAIRKNTDHNATKSAEPSSSCFNGFARDLNAESSNYNLRLDIPSRSAPSSPAHSPQRFSPGDFFTSSYVAPHESNIRSPLRTAFSLNSSPLPSQAVQSPGRNLPSPRGSTFHLHNNSPPERNAAWPESRNVHPLPLPPGALGSPQSPNIHHTIEKSSVSSFKSQWQKGNLIGRGTFGSVYVATNRETGALCAMKEVDVIPDDPKSAESIKQLEKEIEVLSQLKHPNIVQYYGSEMVDDHFCIYLEYIYPGSINKYVRQYCGAVTESVLRNFTRHILHGLAYLHSTNTIHRDIKGANLLVDAAGVVKLADFGVAKHLTGQAYELSLKGSPYWMAPEVMQATMLKDANPDRGFAVDIWSLGCTVIEMMNGKPPWSELEAHAAMFKVLNKTPPIPDALSWEGKDFLRCCFRRNPKERPSARMLLDHPFLRNPYEYNVSVSTQAFSELKLVDKAHNPGDWAKQKTDSKPISPSRCFSNKNMPYNGETSRQCYAENSNSAVACRHSPPMLKALPILSLRQSSHSSYNLIPSAIVPTNKELETMKYHPYALSRSHGREVAHL